MELIRISDRKLKIMLTPADMTQFEMDVETLGEDSLETRKSFRLLMKEDCPMYCGSGCCLRASARRLLSSGRLHTAPPT